MYVDGPDECFLASHLCIPGDVWGSSMCINFYLLEFLVDFAIYFLALFLPAYIVYRYGIKFTFRKWMAITSWVILTPFILFAIFCIVITSDKHLYLRNTTDIEKVMDKEWMFVILPFNH